MNRQGYGKRKHNQESREQQQRDDPVKSIEQTLFHLGDKHPTLSRSQDLDVSVQMILKEFSKYPTEIGDALLACIGELCHKLDIYAELVAILAEKDISIAETIFSKFVENLLFISITNGPWRHALQSLRFLALFEFEGVKNIFTGLVAIGTDYSSWLVLSSLPWLFQSNPELAKELLLIVGPFYPALHTSMLNWSFAIPNIKSFSISNFPQTKLEWAELVLVEDPIWKESTQLSLLQIFPDSFHEEYRDKFEAIYIFNIFSQLCISFELNHRRLSDVLMAAASIGDYGHPEKLVCEFLFAEMLRSPLYYSQIGWQMILMNCCRQSRHFPPILARSVFALVEASRIEKLGWIKLDRLASWFAHHLSNFDFKWPWDEWTQLVDDFSLASLEPSHLLRVSFLKLALENLVRLSYYDRIKEALPPWIHAILPLQASISLDLSSSAVSIVKAIESRAPASQVELLLESEQQDMLASKAIFVQSFIQVGSKTLSHMLVLIETYLSLFQKLHPKIADAAEELADRSITLDIIYAAWANSRLHVEFLVEKLVHYRILSTRSIILYQFTRAKAFLAESNVQFYDFATQILNWTITVTTLNQARDFPRTVAKKLETTSDMAAKEKLTTTISNLEQEYIDVAQVASQSMQELANMSTYNATISLVLNDMILELGRNHPNVISVNQ